MKITNKTVLIAGASAGIGRAMALQLARQGNQLVVTARRQAELDTLAAEVKALGSQCIAIAADALDEEQASAVVSAATEAFGGIDLAILNIGEGPSFNMATETAASVKHNMALNYSTLVNYLVPVIEQMRAQKHGHIAHTNSLAGFLGLPQQGPYSAAKAAGRLLIDTCRVELANDNIKFTSLYPGFVATEAVADDGIPAPFEISEEVAATHMIKGIEKEKMDYLFPFPLRWLIRLARILPKSVVGFLTSKMMADEY